ncbi:glycosyltransferase [Ectothiorhodospira mobilis]|uniref:glycosyltransferase n=1 Tax=Ectothiorhodospira mobilis TaxID=195064 RepID=UPI001EE8AD76|nr:glycosyltransferase [Ectothiorhodospira mobilis]MCG5536649.1 glycosyltransferase [Ectothiorhodospira mobilis]
MSELLTAYARVAGEDVLDHLVQLAAHYRDLKVVHVNSTRVGGGVAEILNKLVPLSRELGLDVDWLVMQGDPAFYQCTKGIHNALQGNAVNLTPRQLEAFEETAARNAETLRPQLEAADLVFIHDPQPAALLAHCPGRRGRWVWRCHVDASRPYRPVWRFLRRYVAGYDASVFSLAAFAQALPHPEYLIPPSIDPLSDKNVDLGADEIGAVHRQFNLDPGRPLVTQVSRFDRFKDPVGVIQAYRLAKGFVPGLQLVLAGGSAEDDPEGEVVLAEARTAAGEDPDVHILALPPDAHRTINALQRASDLVLQKSLREGFGLTVTEALWKGRPVIGGDTGGIRLQVVDHHTGFLVSTPEGAALRMRYLLNNPALRAAMGEKGRSFVRDNFLLTRQLREYLTLGLGLLRGQADRIDLGE